MKRNIRERRLYKYATICFASKVECGESIDVGIMLFSKRCKYLKSLYTINENKLKLLSSELDMNYLKEGLHISSRIRSGSEEGGMIANMDVPDHFWWLTAIKNSCIQVSRPRPGFSEDLDTASERSFKELVL